MEVYTTSAYTTRCDLVTLRPVPGEVIELFAELLAAWGRVASFHDPTSELSSLNAHTEPRVAVSEELAALLHRADWSWQATGGLVDAVRAANPTVLEPDHPAARIGWRANARWEDVRLGTRVVWRTPGVLVDLGGVGKGVIADVIATTLAGIIGEPVLVNLGGDMRAVGEAPWSVLVTHDGSLRMDVPGQAIRFPEGGLATSDRSARRTPLGLDHIVGALPAAGALRRASVVAADAATANTLSLGLVAAGHAWRELWDRFELPTLVVTNDGRRYALGGWPAEDHWLSPLEVGP